MECVCVKYAEQRLQYPTCMAFWCLAHDDIEGNFAKLEQATSPPILTHDSEVKPNE